MLQKTVDRFEPAVVGDTLTVPVPEVDRNQFPPVKEKFLQISDVPLEQEASLSKWYMENLLEMGKDLLK